MTAQRQHVHQLWQRWNRAPDPESGRVFGLAAERVAVFSDQARVIEELVGYLAPHLETAPAAGAGTDWTVRIFDCPGLAPADEGFGEPVVLHDFGADKVVGRRYQQDPGVFAVGGGEQLVVADHSQRRLTIVGPYRAGSLYPRRESSLTGIAHEIVRHLLRVRLEHRGGLVVHGSAIARGEQAVLFVGGKRAGKSTLLSAMLLCSPAAYLAGDRVFVWERPDDHRLAVTGWPTALRLNRETAGIFDGLGAVAAAARAADVAAGEGGERRKLHVLPRDLDAVLGVAVRKAATLTAVVLLGHGRGEPSAEVSQLTAEQGYPLLEPHVLARQDPEHPNWLGLARPCAEDLAGLERALVSRLSESVRLLSLPVCGWTEPVLRAQVDALCGTLGWPADQQARTAPPARPADGSARHPAAGPVTVSPSARGPLVLPDHDYETETDTYGTAPSDPAA